MAPSSNRLVVRSHETATTWPAPAVVVPMKTSPRARLLFSVPAAAAILYGFVTLPFFLLAILNVTNDLDALLREQSGILGALLQAAKAPPEECLARLPTSQFLLQLTATNGAVRLKSSGLAAPLPLPPKVGELLQGLGGHALETLETPFHQHLRILTTLVQPAPPGVAAEPELLQVAVSLDDRQLRLRIAGWWLLIGGLLVVLLPTGVMALIVSHWRRQFGYVCQNARDIDPRSLSQKRLLVPTNDVELRLLTEAFNGLLNRIESTYAAQQHFVADASHELRTPLTILRGEIEVALRRRRGTAEYCEVMQSNKEVRMTTRGSKPCRGPAR